MSSVRIQPNTPSLLTAPNGAKEKLQANMLYGAKKCGQIASSGFNLFNRYMARPGSTLIVSILFSGVGVLAGEHLVDKVAGTHISSTLTEEEWRKRENVLISPIALVTSAFVIYNDYFITNGKTGWTQIFQSLTVSMITSVVFGVGLRGHRAWEHPNSS